jgi:PAS domain S-box-containing protein
MGGLKRTKGTGVQNWLTLLLILVLLPLFILQGYRYYDRYQEKQEEALQANLEIARAVAISFESFVQDVLRQELAIGLAITSSTKMTPGDIIRLLETGRDYPAVRDLNWLNPEGRILYSSNPAMAGADASDRSYFRDVVNGREWAVSELIIGKVSGKPTFVISRGVRDNKGNLLGVIFAAILPEKLDAQLAIERGKGGGISLVDRQGMLVYRYPAIDTTWEERNWLRQYPEYEKVFMGKEISRTFFASYEGKERLASIVPVSSIGWAAGAGKRKEDVTGPIISALVRDAVLFLSVSLIAFLIAAALSRRITNPVEALRAYSSSLGNGEMPERVKVDNVSELKDLAESFDIMAEKVRSREAALQESEQQLRLERDFSTTLLETAGALIIVLNREGRITHFNQACERLTGYSAAEVIGSIIGEVLIPPEDLQGVQEIWNTLCAGDFTNQHENHWIAKNGSRHLIAWTNAAITGQNGVIEHIIGTGLDITERKRTEHALQQAHARAKWLARIPEENPNPVLRVFGDGLPQYCNPAAMELEGWKCEVGQPIPGPVLLLVRKAMAEDR